MTAPRRALVVVLAALLISGAVSAARALREPDEFSETLYVFGTLVEIVIRGADPEAARFAAAETGQLLSGLHHDWHAWRPGALVDLNNDIAAGRARAVDPRLAEVLGQGRLLSCESGGLFDPALGALIGHWGFHADTPPNGGLPDPAAIDAIVQAKPKMTDLILDGGQVSSSNTAVQLDLGGYAKGAALDLAARNLAVMGIKNAVLNAGGDVTVMGDHGDRPWRVAIRDPFGWGVVATVAMRPGEALYTSGNYERFFEKDGDRFSHILDPRTGYPMREIVSTSVLHPDSARADAAATALSVAGPDGWTQVAADMGIEAALLITDGGAVLATPAMAARLDIAGEDWAQALDIIDLPPPAPHPECRLFVR